MIVQLSTFTVTLLALAQSGTLNLHIQLLIAIKPASISKPLARLTYERVAPPVNDTSDFPEAR